jgi:hypothetical protein
MDSALRIYAYRSRGNRNITPGNNDPRALHAALSTNLGVMSVSTQKTRDQSHVTGIWLGDKLFHTSMRYDTLFGGEQPYTIDWYTSELTYINANRNICRCTDGSILPIASVESACVKIASIGNVIYMFNGRSAHALDVRSGDCTLMATKMSAYLDNDRHRDTKPDLLMRVKPISEYAVAVARLAKYDDADQPLHCIQKCIYDMRSPSVPYVYPYEAHIPTECDFPSMIL